VSCRPEEFFSNANKINCNCTGLQGANARARIIEQDASGSFSYPFSTDPTVWQTRHRYTREFCLPGRANRVPSKNNVY
jgi:hypothetical protein